MGQLHFGRISFTLLHMLTGSRNLCIGEKPPVVESFTVVKSWISTFSIRRLTINLTITSHRYLVHQSVSFNCKSVLDIFPVTSSVQVFYPMPILALFPVGTIWIGTITKQLNWRLTVLATTIAFRRAPSTIISKISKIPSNRTKMFVGPTRLKNVRSKVFC